MTRGAPSLSAPLGIALALACGGASAFADGKPAAGSHGPAPERRKDSVEYACTWDAAIAEAQAMRAPLMVHCLDFDASATWGYHGAVLCGKAYVECAASNAVDVVGMIGIEKAARKKDKRAATYEAKVDGATVECLVEFPGLTVADLVAMAAKIAPYDTTGYAPFTVLVDPWTEKEVQHWSGRQSAHALVPAILDARKAFEKEHGKGGTRADARTLLAARARSVERTGTGAYGEALEALAPMKAPSDKWPEALKSVLAAARAAVVLAAEKALSAIEEKKAKDPAAAKREATDLLPRLKGTGLEEKASALLRALG